MTQLIKTLCQRLAQGAISERIQELAESENPGETRIAFDLPVKNE